MLRKFGEDYIAVAVGDGAEDFNKLITLNEVGAYIFEALREEKTFDELVQAVMDNYEVEEELARSDAGIFVESLKQAGLLDA